MAGSKETGKKAAQTSKELYGDEYHKVVGAIGGAVKVPKGLAALSPERRREIARMGGKAGKGKKKRVKDDNDTGTSSSEKE